MFPNTNPTLSPSMTTTLLCFHLPHVLEWQLDQVPTLVTTGDCLHHQADSRAMCDVTCTWQPGSPLQHAQHHLMCPCWLTSHMHTWHTWCPCRSVQHMQHHPVCVCEGTLHFPAPPSSFLTHTWHCSMVPLGLTCSAHKCTSYLACSHWFTSHMHTTLHSGTMGPAHSTHIWGCTTQPSLPPLVCPLHALNITQCPCGSGSAHAPALHMCGHHPCPELIVVLHYIYCTLNKWLSAYPLTVLCACVTIGLTPFMHWIINFSKKIKVAECENEFLIVIFYINKWLIKLILLYNTCECMLQLHSGNMVFGCNQDMELILPHVCHIIGCRIRPTV